MTQKTLFISDTHFEDDKSNHYSKFVQAISDPTVDAIYLLGDIFEAWIGDDDLTPFHQSFIETLKKITARGTPVYFMHGNRDFLIGKRFAELSGCKLLPDEWRVTIYDTPVLLMHGDLLCTNDEKYLKARKLAHKPLIQRGFLSLPLALRRYIAAKLRAKSKRHTQAATAMMMDVANEAVIDVMKKHQVNYLIHGHTHQPDIHPLKINKQPAWRIVLGAWHKRGNMLVWQQDEGYDWVEL